MAILCQPSISRTPGFRAAEVSRSYSLKFGWSSKRSPISPDPESEKKTALPEDSWGNGRSKWLPELSWAERQGQHNKAPKDDLERQRQKNKVPRDDLSAAAWGEAGLQQSSSGLRQLTSAISSLGRRQEWQGALSALSEAREQSLDVNVICFNAALGACARAAQWQPALAVLQNMPALGIQPDPISYSSVMQAFDGRLWPKVLGLFEALRGSGLRSDAVLLSSAVSSCSSGRRWEQALSVFQTCTRLRGLRPDAAVYNAVVDSLGSGQLWQASVSLLPTMLQAGLALTVVSFGAAISASGDSSQWELALGFLSAMPEHQIRPGIASCSSAIRACVRGGEAELAFRMLSDMPRFYVDPAASTYRGAIRAAEEEWPLALRLLRHMQFVGRLPTDAASLAAAVVSCARGRQWAICLRLLQENPAVGVELGVGALGATLGALASAGRDGEAAALMKEMKRRHLELDVIAFSASMSAAERSGQWFKALDTFRQLRESSLRPDDVAVGVAIGAAGSGHLWGQALELLRLADKQGLELGVEQLNCCITAVGRGQQWSRALDLLTSQQARADLVTFNAAVAAAEKGRKWDVALQLLSGMSVASLQPDLVAWSSAISACGGAGQWAKAMSALCNMRAAGQEPSVISFNAAVSACEKGLQWELALSLFRSRTRDRSTWATSKHADGGLSTEGFNAVLLACVRGQMWRKAFGLWEEAAEQPTVQSGAPPSTGARSASSYSLLLSESEQRGCRSREDELLRQLRAAWLWAHGGPANILPALADSKGLWEDKSAEEQHNSLSPERWLFELAPLRPAPAGAAGAAAGAGAASAPYAKELRLLLHVLDTAQPGSPESVCAAIERYGNDVLGSSRSWLKVAGGDKAPIITGAARAAPPGTSVLEIGAYCGYSSLRLAAALPTARIATMDVDPAHVLIARNVIAFAGLAPPRLVVWTGYSRELIPRLRAHYPGPSPFGAVFMDQRGSRYDEDLALLEAHGLLRAGAVVIADNVLKPGAPLLLWRVARGVDPSNNNNSNHHHNNSNSNNNNNYATQLLRVREFAMPVEDWMSVTVVRRPGGQSSQGAGEKAALPDLLWSLHERSDWIRQRALLPGRGVDFSEWASFAARMKAGLAKLGIFATADAGTWASRR
ncbi:unnamed protein product [Polarella glacialis]|uniref:Catechol O-methyltransferase n=1 Tax=Polarella glacialis TaxID=89957 RepID=A0A813ET41_POLGL|nr:unnamed protein product [Polarella glacialis]